MPNTLLVVGNEGQGVRPTVANQCDWHVHIPRGWSPIASFAQTDMHGQQAAAGEKEGEEGGVGAAGGEVLVVDSLNVSNAVAVAVYEVCRAQAALLAEQSQPASGGGDGQ
jgi:hypothetical protein